MDRPNVVWITLDSVRSDHTTLDGYHRETTPTLSDLAEAGVGFRNCITAGKDTLTSSGGILTGLAPTHSTLGITGNRLPETVRTVPERFAEAGYQTAALSGNYYVSEETGLARGFDRFQLLSSSTLHQLGPRILLRYLRVLHTHSAGFTLDASKHSAPFLMNQVAKGRIREFDDRPFFYYLHYNEPHRPYYPPRGFRDRFAADLEMTPAEAAEKSIQVHRDLEEIIAGGADLTPAEWDALEVMYDTEIAYTDRMVGRLVSWLRERNAGPTVVVVTADHGELFGEYDLLSHKYVLDDAVTRVPLVVATLDGETGSTTTENDTRFGDEFAVEPADVVQHWDVMRTLLELAGADTEGLCGVDLRADGREFAVSQRAAPDFGQIRQHNPDYETSRFHSGVTTALRTAKWRYTLSEDRRELIRLPDETTDVSDVESAVRDRLHEQLEAWLEEYGTPIEDGIEREFSETTRQQLRRLGYID